MKKLFITIIVLVLITATIVGCASRSDEAVRSKGVTLEQAVSGAAMPEEAPMADYEMAEADMAMDEDGVSSEFNNGGVDLETNRKLIYTAYYSIETTDFDADYAFILATLDAYDGYAQNSSVDGTKPTEYGDPGRYANLSLRIPVSEYDAFLKALDGVGNILSKSQNANDVSAQYFDTESRIRILNTQLDRLEDLLARADKIEDIIVLEQEISSVMYELDRYEGQMRQLDNLIDYTTVSISLMEVNEISTISESEKGLGQRIAENLKNVFNRFVRFLEGLVIFLVAGLPVWVFLGIIAVVVVWIVKRSKKRRAARAAKKADKK